MPTKKVVRSEASVSSLAGAAVPVKARKRSASVSAESKPAPAEKKTPASRKKAAVAADTETVAAVTHRHKKQDLVAAPFVEEAQSAVAAPAYEPSHEEVAKLAYSYYVARGYQPGNQSADWFRAVYELKQRHLASLLSDAQ